VVAGIDATALAAIVEAAVRRQVEALRAHVDMRFDRVERRLADLEAEVMLAGGAGANNESMPSLASGSDL
jgi:hypothetical protein